MKTQHCDLCKHATMRALPKPVLICAMLHKPRFYAPVYFQKETWGWKRKCSDFEHMNHCNTCNASHENTVERVIRCGTCKMQPVGMPTKYKAAHGIKGDA